MYINRIAEERVTESLASSKILLVLGARQVGKTTLLKHCLANRAATFLNLDIEVDKARFRAAAHLSPTEAIRSLNNPEVLVIDEAQRLPESSRIVKGWYDAHLPVKIILLGSSSLDLLDQSVESLTGRNTKLFLPPLLFEEALRCTEWYSSAFTSEMIAETFAPQLEATLLQSVVYGNYPEIFHTPRKTEYLVNLASDYILKDVIQSGLVKSADVIKKLLLVLAHRVGETLSTNELAKTLGISRLTVDKYLDLLERTYVIFRLPPFSTSQRAEITRQQKVYFWDTGIRNALLNDFNVSPFRSDMGALWKNWVVAEAAKQALLEGGQRTLYYWRTADGGNVDLVIQDQQDLYAYEAVWSSRQAKGSRSFMQQYGLPIRSITHEMPFFPPKADTYEQAAL